MIERLINSNLGFLKKYISCDDDTVEIYRYSLRIIYSYIIDVLVLMGLASVTHKVIETVIILFTFAVMQVYGGGYHANTKIGCLSIMVVGWFIGVFALERVVSIHWSIAFGKKHLLRLYYRLGPNRTGVKLINIIPKTRKKPLLIRQLFKKHNRC